MEGDGEQLNGREWEGRREGGGGWSCRRWLAVAGAAGDASHQGQRKGREEIPKPLRFGSVYWEVLGGGHGPDIGLAHTLSVKWSCWSDSRLTAS